MEFISGGNIFSKPLNKPMQRTSDFGGREYVFENRPPPPPKVPYINFVSVLSGYETNIYNHNICISL